MSDHTAADAIASVDHVLTTTRAVRRRLDLERPVANDVLYECIDIAEQAPTGGDQASRRWMVVRDPAVKAEVARVYREIAESFMPKDTAGNPVMASARHLVDHLADVPALVIVTIHGTHDGSGNPGLFDSVLQAAWSFCLALRARGLGSAWTTLHLTRRDDIAALLGIPADVTQCVLLPVAHTIGTDFHPAPRRPAHEITYVDRWGFTTDQPPGPEIGLADGPGVTAEIDIAAPTGAVWAVVSDISVPAQFSDELREASWIDEPGPGARFQGKNKIDGVFEWETTSYVTDWQPKRRFAWSVVDPDSPGATWSFDLEPKVGGHTRLRFHVTIGPGFSGTSQAMADHPDKAGRILARRRRTIQTNMRRTLLGIRDITERSAD